MKRYNPKEIEPRWQRIWDETGVYTADLLSDKPKYIAMSMFNYPSGAGIHIGHAMNYTISDVKARFKRQQGFESYHPVGWDAFGLPAENYAIKAGVSPQESMATIIPSYHKQYKAMGWSNDWEKEIATHLPEYYKWTQWIFWKMHQAGLAYQESRLQWWCELDNSVLANEQVIDGKCWRHDGPGDPLVEKREVKQWFFKITDYADELLDAIDGLDWTESVKLAQKNWIGKSVGAEIDFQIDGSNDKITVFTTRADTLFGATFMVLAPEHPLVDNITTKDKRSAVDKYREESLKKSEVERQENKAKTGEFTGAYAINPANGQKIPIWVADYVLYGYGTGAIMAVPGHDERDYEFAKKFGLPVVEVVEATTYDDENPPQTGKKNTKRNVTICIVKNKQGKYLTLKWNRHDWHNFVMGGVEDGEDLVDAAKREIVEETGYVDVEFKGRMPFALNSVFYAAHKDVNRDIRVDVLRFDLKSDKQVAVKHESHEDFVTVWVDKAQLSNLHPVGGLDYIVRWLEDGDYVYSGEGRIVNSGTYDGLGSAEIREKIVNDLLKKDAAHQKVNYRMRDWSVSRQRYWGAPIPIINCPKDGAVLVPEDQLPVILPELEDFKLSNSPSGVAVDPSGASSEQANKGLAYAPIGDGRSALARATDWLKVECPKCGGKAERETDTLDTYICSSWYMYRYFDPHNQHAIFDSDIVKKWEPIDFYNGADHATAHLLYARFIGHFFKKLGLVNQPEPFKQFLFNGKVTAADGQMFSKSKGNGIDPLEIINQGYGADALRTYMMFAAPLDLWVRWDPQGVPGTHRFLSRIWNLVQEYRAAPDGSTNAATTAELRRSTHAMAKKMTEDIEANHYNTAIAAAMTAVNELYKLKVDNLKKNDAWQQALEFVVACVAPFAPHIADELWLQLGHHLSIQKDSWPKVDESYLQTDQVTIAVQVNGKLRGELTVRVSATETDITKQAQNDANVAKHLTGQTVKKTIYVPGRLVNFVV